MRVLHLGLVVFGFLLPCALHAEDNPCLAALPKDGQGAVYNQLRTSSYSDLHYLVDEYVYQMNFSTHDEALHAGLNIGTVVYGVPLKIGGVFDKSSKDEWRSEYELKRKTQFSQTKLSSLDVKTLDPSVITVIAESCMPFGMFSSYRPVDDCHFVFRAGYRSDRRKADPVIPATLTVVGGQCTKWPKLPLSPSGDQITCTRSGNGAVIVTLNTREAGSRDVAVPALARGLLPPEPQEVETLGDIQVQDVSLGGWTYDHVGNNVGCPNCKDLFAKTFAPNLAAFPQISGATAIIASASLSSQAGDCSHFYRCPDSGGCGPAQVEFAAPGNPAVSCVGQSACTVYRAVNGSRACTDVIHLGFYVKHKECQNCNGKSYADAHAQWTVMKENAEPKACPALAAQDPQKIYP